MEKNTGVLKCWNCGDPISENYATLYRGDQEEIICKTCADYFPKFDGFDGVI